MARRVTYTKAETLRAIRNAKQLAESNQWDAAIRWLDMARAGLVERRDGKTKWGQRL